MHCSQSMASATTARMSFFAYLVFVVISSASMATSAPRAEVQQQQLLSSDFYEASCPLALPTIRAMVEAAVALQPRAAAGLLRLHFHDCFVNGCDGSVLLDDSPSFQGEKTAKANNNSLRGFELVDAIKAAVNTVCFGNVVSCADLLAVAARDAVVAVGGSSYDVLLGRRDATTTSRDAADAGIPSPSLDLPDLIAAFESHGLTAADLVILSGGHTLGYARCSVFRDRLYNETSSIDASFASKLQEECPRTGGEDDSQVPLDGTPAAFDASYFRGLVESKGLLHSDQQLFRGDAMAETDALVRRYAENPDVFSADFGAAMVRMGNISPLTGSYGEIRENCRAVNA